jgi:hypothetical protein
MAITQEQAIQILKFLDGDCTTEQLQEVNQLFSENPDARNYLVSVSEQAIVAGDLLNVSVFANQAKSRLETGFENSSPNSLYLGTPSRAWIPLTLLVCTLIVGSATSWSVLASFRGTRPIVGTIQQAHGLLDLRGNSGGQASRIDAGQQVFAGDILESKSCDSWLEMDIAADSKLTLASHSSVRMLQAADALSQDYELLRGGLWVDCRMDQSKKVRIVTPTATIESANGAFNVRVTETETVLWVHRGQATVFQAKDGQSASLQAGVELSMSLENSGALSIKPQSSPTNSWLLTWPLDHQIVYGKVLNNFNDEPKIKAMPMLWPLPNRDPLLLHVSAIGAWRQSPRPIVLLDNSALRFRGRTQRLQSVRFGFSTQKFQGVFGGKFEVDVAPSDLDLPGQIWQVDLPLDRFKALYPQLNQAAGGLQLLDVYALTVQEDAGLEILGVELIPSNSP